MATDANGFVSLASRHSVEETVERFQALLETKGIRLFALIDHSGEAQRAGLEMPPTKLLIFGNPKAGTPLMIAAPSLAIDLPLKALIWQDAAGAVWISHNTPAYLLARHGLAPEFMPAIAGVEALFEKAV